MEGTTTTTYPSKLGEPALRVRVRSYGRTVELALEGEFDLAAAARVRAAVRTAFEQDSDCLVLDLARVTFMDSTGIHVALEAGRRAQAQQVRLVIIPGPTQVQRLFDLCGLTNVLPFAPDGEPPEDGA